MSNLYIVDGEYQIRASNVIITAGSQLGFITETGELIEAFNDNTWGHVKKSDIIPVDKA